MTPERWQEIEKFYHFAHERGREVLEDADPEIRRQVELLLAQDSAGKFLDGLCESLSRVVGLCPLRPALSNNPASDELP